jgi:hypothetical protein
MPDRAIPLLALSLLAGCADSMCGNRILQTLVSPDGQHVAVMFERDCGGPTRESFQVSILPPGAIPNGRGDIYISEPNRKPGEDGRVPVELTWLGPDRLRIGYRPSDEIFERVEEWDGVVIEYRASDAGH